jgi:phosphohistidine phosphatase
VSRRLLLIRHAKSSWDDASLADRDRPLSKRGRSAATRIGEHLRAAGLVPDLVVCSTAHRTRETLERLALPDVEVRYEEELYAADAEAILSRIRSAPDASTALAVIGHNPGMHDLAVGLASSDAGELAGRLRAKLPTGAVAVFESDEPWARVAPDHVRLVAFVIPRELA